MIDLTNTDAIKKIDPQDTLGSTELLLTQCKAAWEQVNALPLTKFEEPITKLVMCGMGASVYGALVLKAIMGRDLPFPIEIVSDYFLPEYVDKNTLVVLTSYSGTTEEVLSCAEDALAKEAKMVILTKGGKLAEFAQDHNVPGYIFDGKLNPAGIPRLGNGYSIIGLIGLLNKLGVIDIEENEISYSLTRFAEKMDDIRAQAQNDYLLLENKLPIIFSAEHLAGNAQILRNQFNETSKTFSAFFLIPDLNHHLMEGLQFPKDAPLHFIIMNTSNYAEKIKKRIELTKEIIAKHNYPILEFTTSGQTVYDDFLETMVYGSFLTLYLGLDYGQNPATNPWVDWFKAELTPKEEK